MKLILICRVLFTNEISLQVYRYFFQKLLKFNFSSTARKILLSQNVWETILIKLEAINIKKVILLLHIKFENAICNSGQRELDNNSWQKKDNYFLRFK
jgi:hypothetical protein